MRTTPPLNINPESRQILQELLAALRAAHWSHWTSHWQVKGSPYYGDHLMMERLYNAVSEEIDTLAEKIVAIYGPSAVEAVRQMQLSEDFLKQWKRPDPLEQAFVVEDSLQYLFAHAFQTLENMGQMSLGMNDFIAAAANSHETAVYLLTQRLR